MYAVVKCSHNLSEPHQSCSAVYPRALYSDLCFSHCTPLLSVHLFPHSHSSVTICMLMTPSCSYPSTPPSSMKIFLACKLLLVLSLTGWLQTSYICASTVLKPNFCYLVSYPNWTKFTIQHLPSVMVLQSVPHPQLAILVSSLMPISPFPIRFLQVLLTRAVPHPGSPTHSPCPWLQYSPHHWHITRTLKARLLQLHSGLPKTQLTRLDSSICFCAVRCCSSQVFWSWPDSQFSPLA